MTSITLSQHPVPPPWLTPAPWRQKIESCRPERVVAALSTEDPGESDLAALLSPAADEFLEEMARRAQSLTRQHFGRTIALFAPLYLSDHCSGGCAYCGFAADRKQPRKVLSPPEIRKELEALKSMGFDDVLLLTGERSPHADVDYLVAAVSTASEIFHRVTLEAFPMTEAEYRRMAEAGCTGVTLYQETYDPAVYEAMHRWGPKRDYLSRLEAPESILSAGIRIAGLGVLLGLADPLNDVIALFQHARFLRKHFWEAGLTLSFPRVCPQEGGFIPPCPVNERLFFQIICAIRICLPDTPLVLSTRESPPFRDGVAGIGITRMSVASRTTVGGYSTPDESPDGQFHVNDNRNIKDFCAMLQRKQLEPVFKNWEAIFR